MSFDLNDQELKLKLLELAAGDVERAKQMFSWLAVDEFVLRDKRIHELESALFWCSAASDFQRGGQARLGWLKLCAPLIDPKRDDSEEIAALEAVLSPSTRGDEGVADETPVQSESEKDKARDLVIVAARDLHDALMEYGFTPDINDEQVALANALSKLSAPADVAIPEGFVPWAGGKRPVPVGATVDVLFEDGSIAKDSSAEIWDRVPYGHDYWSHKPIDRRIIAYRVTAVMSEHDHSPKSPVGERAWIHFMSASGYSGGNGWSDGIDWTQVDLYEIRPEGPPDLSRYAGSEEVNLNSTAPVIDAEPEAPAEPAELPTQLDSQAQEEGEPAEIISTLTGDPAIEPESGLHEEPPAPQPQATSEQGEEPIHHPDASYWKAALAEGAKPKPGFIESTVGKLFGHKTEELA